MFQALEPSSLGVAESPMEALPSWSPSEPPKRRKRRDKRRRTKPQLLTRADLDNRTCAAKAFDKLYADISSDLGGDLTAVERSLVEGFVGSTVVLQALNTKLALGQEINLGEYGVVCSSMVRIAAKIGLSRRARIVSGLIEAEVAPPLWSPLRDTLAKDLARRVGLDDDE
jgi:hypothetical protein